MAGTAETAYFTRLNFKQGSYIPEKHIHAPLAAGQYRWLNDPQPPVYDEAAQKWRAWYLYNANADISGKKYYKTVAADGTVKEISDTVFVNGGTEWFEISSTDLISWQNEGVRLPKGRQTDGSSTPSIMSGCCTLNLQGKVRQCPDKVLYFASIDENNNGRSVGLWTAGQLGEMPVYRGVVLENTAENIFRDPRITVCNGVFIMAIAANGSAAADEDYQPEGSINFYESSNGRDWRFLSKLQIDKMGIVECPQLVLNFNNTGKALLIWSGNPYKNGGTAGTYARLGRFDGAFFTPEHHYDFLRDRLDYGADWYAGVVFSKDNDYYCLGWLNNWDYAPNLPCPDFNGILDVKKLEQRGIHCALTPLPVLKNSYKNSLRHECAVYQGNTRNLNADSSNIGVFNLPESCLCRFYIKGWLDNGDSLAIARVQIAALF